MQRVFVAPNLAQAHLVKHALEQEGLAPEVRGENLVSSMGLIPVTGDTQPSVWVEDAVADDAAAIVQNLLAEGLDAEGDGQGEADEAPANEAPGELLGELFEATDRLRRDPRRGEARHVIQQLSPVVDASSPPYGVEQTTWADVRSLTTAISSAQDTDDEEQLREAAERLWGILRQLV